MIHVAGIKVTDNVDHYQPAQTAPILFRAEEYDNAIFGLPSYISTAELTGLILKSADIINKFGLVAQVVTTKF